MSSKYIEIRKVLKIRKSDKLTEITINLEKYVLHSALNFFADLKSDWQKDLWKKLKSIKHKIPSAQKVKPLQTT